MAKSKWYGYKTRLNTYKAEVYVSPDQIIKAEKNKLNEIIVGPFDASSEYEAIEIIKAAVGN